MQSNRNTLFFKLSSKVTHELLVEKEIIMTIKKLSSFILMFSNDIIIDHNDQGCITPDGGTPPWTVSSGYGHWQVLPMWSLLVRLSHPAISLLAVLVVLSMYVVSTQSL